MYFEGVYSQGEDRILLGFWCDSGGAPGGGGVIMATQHMYGRFDLPAGRFLDFYCDYHDNRIQPIRIGSQSFDFMDGGLFLISTSGETPRIKQTKMDAVSNAVVRGNASEIFARMKSDPVVQEFFAE